MICLNCGSSKSKAIAKYDNVNGILSRRRQCIECGQRFTTYEVTKKQFDDLMGELGKYKMVAQILDELLHKEA